MVRTELLAPVLPPASRLPCPSPARLPDHDLSEAEITTLWGRDRSGLSACEQRRAAAVKAVDAAGKRNLP